MNSKEKRFIDKIKNKDYRNAIENLIQKPDLRKVLNQFYLERLVEFLNDSEDDLDFLEYSKKKNSKEIELLRIEIKNNLEYFVRENLKFLSKKRDVQFASMGPMTVRFVLSKDSLTYLFLIQKEKIDRMTLNLLLKTGSNELVDLFYKKVDKCYLEKISESKDLDIAFKLIKNNAYEVNFEILFEIINKTQGNFFNFFPHFSLWVLTESLEFGVYDLLLEISKIEPELSVEIVGRLIRTKKDYPDFDLEKLKKDILEKPTSNLRYFVLLLKHGFCEYKDLYSLFKTKSISQIAEDIFILQKKINNPRTCNEMLAQFFELSFKSKNK